MIKEVTQIRGKYLLNNSKNLSFLSPIRREKDEIKTSQTNKVLSNNKYVKIDNRIKMGKNKNLKKGSFNRNLLSSKCKSNKNIRNIKTYSKTKVDNISLSCINNAILPKNRNPGNNKVDNLFYSIINNSNSNIFNSTTETSQNIRKNKDNIKNSYKTSNTDYNYTTLFVPSIKNLKETSHHFHHIHNMKMISPLEYKPKKIKKKEKEKEKIPDFIMSIKKLENNFVKPIRKEYNVKHVNSLDIKNKIKKLKNDIFENYKEMDIIKKNKSLINFNSKKYLSVLLMQKVKSEIDNNDIANIKEDICNIMSEIKNIKKKTKIYKLYCLYIEEEIQEYKNEIKKLTNEINYIYDNKNNVKSMIILLHKRIIDAKERIKKMDKNKNDINRVWHELSLKYFNIINKTK
jgi:hypothetical protein